MIIQVQEQVQKQSSIVYIIGPSFKTQGGISSVLLIYNSHFRDALNMRFIPSYSGNSRIADVILFAVAIFRVFFLCLFVRQAVFHIHSSTYASFFRKSLLARCCLFFRKKVILHIHGADFDTFLDDISYRWRIRSIMLLNAVDRVVVLSESWRAFFEKHVAAEKIRVIVNPSSTYDPACTKMHSKWHNEQYNEAVKVLFIGRIGQRKGAYDLIEAVKKLRSLNFILDLVGDGEGDIIREIVNANGLGNTVSIYDWVSHKDIGEWYNKADILVLPSYAEGLPMSVLEAIGIGLPVISTDVGGIPEAVIDGINGYIISPGDVEALAEKMSVLIKNASLRREMGNNSLKIAGEKFSIEKNYTLLKELYCK